MKAVFSRTVTALAAAATLGTGMCLSPGVQASDPFIGQIVMFGGNFAPRNWAMCDGQFLSISSNTALFAILGTTYGGDGRTTFALPDLRGRVAIHPGQAPGLSRYVLGQRGGQEQVSLSISQMPSHTHIPRVTVHATSTNGNQTTPDGGLLANDPREDQYSNAPAPNVTMNSATVVVINENTGGGLPHENRQPYLAVNHLIATQGTFPSRP